LKIFCNTCLPPDIGKAIDILYDIKIKETDVIDPAPGKPMELSLSRVLREKSGGETQTPYYVAIAPTWTGSTS
jgi:hypothetical protein